MGKTDAPAGGPGEPPEGFVGTAGARDEWVWYWASTRVRAGERDPRRGASGGGTERGRRMYIGGGILAVIVVVLLLLWIF